MPLQLVHLDDNILTWNAVMDGGECLDLECRTRAYEYLTRAEQFIEPSGVDLDSIDCIANLRRSMTHRVRQLEEVYKFREKLNPPMKRHSLELLADLGAIRPAMLKDLLSIRNAIEYENAKPPSPIECQRYADIIWYFLKATDSLLHTKRTSLNLTPREYVYHESPLWLSIRYYEFERQTVDVNGWIPKEMVSQQKSLVAINAHTYGTKKERWGNAEIHSDKKDDDIWISGAVTMNEQLHHRLLRLLIACP